MRIVCTAVENYKLTLGKIYESDSESRDFYKLLNDNNIGVRYSKRLFRLATADETGETAAPVVVPPPPALTERDLVNSITIVGDQVTFIDFDRERKVVEDAFDSDESRISCGVRQITGINNQIQIIDDFFELEEDDFLAIRKALFAKCIEVYVRRQLLAGVAFGIMSTNVSGSDEDDNNSDEDLLSVLDTIANSTTEAKVNPNSDNQIKVWVLTRLN